MGNIALPFLTLAEDDVKVQWLIGPSGQLLQPASDLFHNWDYALDLEVSVNLSLDLHQSAKRLGMEPDGLQLRAILYGGTGPGTMPRRIVPLDNVLFIHGEATPAASIHGAELSERLRLEVQIVLDRTGLRASPLAATTQGSRLWSARRDIMLEDGGASRFPIELASFSRMLGPQTAAHAPWYVDWRPSDISGDFAGSVRVYVNSDIETFTERFVASDPLTLQAILGDVMAQTIGGALDMVDATDTLESCIEGSLGYQIRGWLDMAFPGQELHVIKRRRDERPGEFMSTILACAQMAEKDP